MDGSAILLTIGVGAISGIAMLFSDARYKRDQAMKTRAENATIARAADELEAKRIELEREWQRVIEGPAIDFLCGVEKGLREAPEQGLVWADGGTAPDPTQDRYMAFASKDPEDYSYNEVWEFDTEHFSVRRMQKKIGVPVDGILGPQTEHAAKRYYEVMKKCPKGWTRARIPVYNPE